MSRTRASGCMCGAVALELTGDPAVQAFCHCESCRGWLGAPIHAASLWPAASVRIAKGADELGTDTRTEASHRKVCKRCGTPVLVDHPALGMVDVPAGRVVCRVDTTKLGPLVDAQRPHTGHTRHVPGAIMVQITGTLGNLHAVYVLGLRVSEGWVGFGTHVRNARFRGGCACG